MAEALVAACASLLVTVVIGGVLLNLLRARKVGKAYTGDEPEAYRAKAGTPTMGGIMFLLPIIVISLIASVSRDIDLLLPLGAMAAAASLGLVDDFQTLVGKEKLSGHEPWFWAVKWSVHVAIGVIVAAVLYFRLDLDNGVLPWIGSFSLGAAYLPVLVLVLVVGTSGAVITDGMDGLMAGICLLAYGAYGIIALDQGQEALGAFALVVVGGTAGFLWFNSHPAQVFMGETGSQALAVGLIVLAFMTDWWLLLPVVGIVFVAEGLSDVIQIGYFKLTKGRRIFRMAPIHYHFQLLGWAETQVVARLWLVGLLGAMAGVALTQTIS